MDERNFMTLFGKIAALLRLILQSIGIGSYPASGPAPAKEKHLKHGIPQITATELKQRLDAGDNPFILDVREPFEYKIAQIGGTLIPLNELPQRLNEIPKDREIVVHCKMGGRSQRAAEYLSNAGYPRVLNLSGGIVGWASAIDPSIPTY